MASNEQRPAPPSAVVADSDDRFRSLTALRAAHTDLLARYSTLDEDHLPEDFVADVRSYLQRGAASGRLLDADEDRSEAQTLLNYWTTVLYAAGVTTTHAILAHFDAAIAAASVGDVSPYRGLSAFDQGDHPVFYGRGRLVRRMTEWLEQNRFLAVLGLSGSGKSSLVRAGLMPALAEGAVNDSENWRFLQPTVPGSDPLANLAAVTCPAGETVAGWRQRLATDRTALIDTLAGARAPVLLVIDQFEELFTIAQPEEVRITFIEHLVTLVRAEGLRHTVIVTLRTDFEPYVARYEALADLFRAEATVHVPPLDVAGLRAAIEKPAARRGVRFEPGLIEELVQQVIGEPAGLPLLQFTLLKLWEHREGTTITRAAYKALGGSVRDILARSATETYESLALQEDREVVEEIFRHLVTYGGAGETTSRRIKLTELRDIPANPERVQRVLDLLVGAGLLRISGGVASEDQQVEVTHEALIRNWRLLGEWLEKGRDERRRRYLLTEAAQWWDGHNRQTSDLLRGARLEAAEQVPDLSHLERAFVSASRAEVSRSQRNWWNAVVGALAIVIVLLAAALVQSYRVGNAISTREQIQRERDAIRTERDTIELRTAEARLRYTAVKNDLAIAETQLADVERTLEEAAKAVERATTEATQAKEQSKRTQEQLETVEDEQKKLQVGVKQLFAERPAIAVTPNGLGEVPPSWRKLQAQAPAIARNSAGVGLYRTDKGQIVATAFLVGADIALTFAAKDFIPRGGEVDFGDQPSAESPLRFAVVNVVAVDPNLYTAVVRLQRVSTAGRPLPAPLRIARQANIGSGSPVYVIGFPMEDARTSKEVSRAVFSRFGIKRVQPGYVLSVSQNNYLHDCFSTGGSAGSPLIDLATGLVVGLHYAGQMPTAEGPGIKQAIGSWALIPLLQKAGLRVQ